MKPEEIEAYISAAARLIDLPLAAEYRQGVAQYFAMAAGMAESLEAFALEAEAESAVVFIPVAPDVKVAP